MHRLMAETFLPNPKGLKVVIFKDDDITFLQGSKQPPMENQRDPY